MNHSDDNRITTSIHRSHPQRQRRRRSRSVDNGIPNDDPYHTSIPWQAMKRLRVDATTTSTDSSFPNNDVPMSTTPTPDDAGDRTQQQREHHQAPPSTLNYCYENDSYFCYQYHQQQETGQDTDGWSSPEHNSTTTPDLHDRTTTITRRPMSNNTTITDNDDMDYENVNHILGNLHLERQQRRISTHPQQQQQHAPRHPRQTEEKHSKNVSSNNTAQHINDSTSFSQMTTTSSSSLTTLPPTPLNTRMLLRQQQQFLGGPQQQQPSSSSSAVDNNNNEQFHYQTPPPSKPTKRKVLQLYTNSKLG